ncbi:MAG: hypothetical protein GYB19_03970 [Rhodospirillales bacterium]|nr:hypothetical protein [Rhodospirillales bacterium]
MMFFMGLVPDNPIKAREVTIPTRAIRRFDLNKNTSWNYVGKPEKLYQNVSGQLQDPAAALMFDKTTFIGSKSPKEP